MGILRLGGHGGLSGHGVMRLGAGVGIQIGIGAGRDLAAEISAWQDAQTDLIHAAGLKEALFGSAGNAGAVTYITPQEAFRQNGLLISAKVRLGSAAWTDGVLKLKIFRWNATNSVYDMVTEQSFTVSGLALSVQTVTFSPPITVQIGDVPGFFSTPNLRTTATDWTARAAVGDVTTSDAFASTSANRSLCIDWLMYAPYLAVTGDSIPEGQNTLTPNYSALQTGGTGVTRPWFVAVAEIMAQLRSSIGGGTTLKYQNLALGGMTFAWVASTGIIECHAVKPHTIIVHCGVNDINTARTWAAVEADLDTTKAAITTEELLISEILPWTNGTDEQAATVRSFNASIAVWCAANGATLIACHDAMGQVRVSTGEIDDLATAYDQDGVHLTAAGVAALAAIWKAAL